MMGQTLIIVESPSKAKTISKYLGKGYIVEASMGHVRDLPKSQLGVNVDNNYEPKYITIRGKGPVLEKLRKASKKSDTILLATDPDREGEAISWHLAKALKIDETKKCRIEFNEITKNAVNEAIKNPRQININLVNAQQARRILDRLVGYKISPILWRKVKWGLSAGRVQSVTLKIICDREKEIIDFVPEEYWTIECMLNKEDSKEHFKVKLSNYKNKKIEINDKEQCDNIINELKEGNFEVSQIKKSTKKKNPLPPFTTSTLQQDANRKLNYSTKKTMAIAQKLYEGVEVKGYGSIGLITYMRTDSVRISSEAQKNAREYIASNYGKEYLPEEIRNFKSKKNIQDAHEAIRPSNMDLPPSKLKDSLRSDQYKLYELIWNRFMASQMATCIMNTTSVEIINGDYKFRASGSNIKFDGFMIIYNYITENEKKDINIPKLEKGEKLIQKSIDGIQHFTQPPPRFSEASLVKTLEENGIGRPSTYSPIISTLLDRTYIEKEKKILQPTELGEIVNDIVSEYFNQIVDIDFTAGMEDKLDSIEEGNEEWRNVVDEFYKPLEELIEIADKQVSKITIQDKVTDVICEKCGKNMVIKHGRYGDFLACPGYPECKNTKPIIKKLDVNCPKCGGKVIVRKSKKGAKFYGCSNYPKCDFISWFEPIEKKCPKCGSYMVKRFTKSRGNYQECSNKECKYREESIENNEEGKN